MSYEEGAMRDQSAGHCSDREQGAAAVGPQDPVAIVATLSSPVEAAGLLQDFKCSRCSPMS
jgi:hypothetical protein